ncbi:hypothetical protein [Halobellus sp. H-GB7]|uniref:hypothetical protein n=1 Tax=Halobellus sp. H-GB7 TaxID=3069756 RepID=UPI0027B29D0F|nr:hypothetical protein [Halobellus sp. H-GB7]MDQ2053222.1 hypothetical protein [Halobellus sp. H-GB7]
MDFGPLTLPTAVASLLGLLLTAGAAYLGGRTKRARSAVIRFETELRRILEDKWGIPSPATRRITRSTIDQALQNAIAPYDGSNDPIRVAYTDGTWLAPIPADVDLLRVGGVLTSILPYRPERFDCENFAGAFRALVAFGLGTNTVGVVIDWSGGHAYNVIVDADGGVTFYEPQDDRVVEVGKEGNYQLQNALIVF